MMQERLLKLLLIGAGGLLLSPAIAVGAWSVAGSIWGNIAIVFLSGGWFWALLHFVVRNRRFPIALSWEEEQRRKAERRREAAVKEIAHGT